MSNDSQSNPKKTGACDDAQSKVRAGVSRRDTFKLATAISALGIGLGATLKSGEALAELHKLDASNAIKLSLNFYKLKDGQPVQLLHTVDLTQQTIKLRGEGIGQYAIKLESESLKEGKLQKAVIADHVLEIHAGKF